MMTKGYEPLNDKDKKVIIETAKDFFYEYTSGDPVLCKLSALYASITQLRLQNGKTNPDPQEVFEVLYSKFGNSLFSQYTGRVLFHSHPSKQQLKRFIERSIYPAAHYFTESPSLWEYGVKMFGVEATTLDFAGNNVLVSAAKVEKYETVNAILRSTLKPEQRQELIAHRNSTGNTILHIIMIEYTQRNLKSYRESVKAILSYLDEEEQDILLNIKNNYGLTPLSILTDKISNHPQNKDLALMQDLLANDQYLEPNMKIAV